MGIDGVELGRFDQGVGDGSGLAACFGTDEEVVLPPKGNSLVFSTSGWRRVSQVGRTQKTVDLELTLPSTAERAFVQVKSQASTGALDNYVARLAQAEAYDRMFFVWHTGDIPEENDPAGVIVLGPQKLSRMVLDAGLSSWLREKSPDR